jgi:predicted ATPase
VDPVPPADRQDRWLFIVLSIRSGEVLLDDRLGSILLELRQHGHLEEIALGPLNRSETTALGIAVSGRQLDEAASRELHEETEGHPLYVVEVTRARLSGAHQTFPLPVEPGSPAMAPSRRPLPERVLAIIEARLAQLSPPTRQVVGLASVIGRRFSLPLLVDGLGMGECEIVAALDELLERRLVREQAGDTYDFSHDSIREVAYNGLASARRQLFHHRIASSRITSAAGASDLLQRSRGTWRRRD